MRTRVIAGIISAILLIIVLLAPLAAANAVAAIIALLALFEVFSATELLKKKILVLIGAVFCFAFTYAHLLDGAMSGILMFMFTAALFFVYMTQMSKISLADIAKVLFLTIYIGFAFAHAINIRIMHGGQFMIWLLFICTCATDSFAMIGGMIFGKHKLCSSISPKKTVEGSISGVVACVICALIYCLILARFFKQSPNYLNAAILALITSVFAQLGDLAASCIKRQYNVKDYGKIIPGHGGMLDRVDSLLFAAPIMYYLLMVLSVI